MTRARDLAAGTFELATGGVLKLETSDTTVTDGSVLGKIEFKAPDEASGTDAILVGAAIEAVAEGTFAADNNATELVFKTGASAAADAKMTLTSGGTLLVGQSSQNSANAGVSIEQGGKSYFTRDGGHALDVNRLNSDGNIAVFRKDGTTVGSIGSYADKIYIGNGDTGLRFVNTSNQIRPFNTSTLADRDNGFSLGSSGARFTNLYLSGGVYLGGTGAANKLDDYEEGTWTPSGATGFPGGGAPQSITATYTKVGDTVSVRAVFNAYNDGTNLNISGLPFSASANSAASISISTGKSFVNERVSGSSFYCTISGTDTSLRTFYLEATYRTAS